MKVNGVGVRPTDLSKAKTKDLETFKNGKKSNAGQEVAGSAKVNVSSKAQDLQKAKQIASEQSVDEAKVSRLQKLIDEGKYNVNASAVADKIVDEHLLMGD